MVAAGPTKVVRRQGARRTGTLTRQLTAVQRQKDKLQKELDKVHSQLGKLPEETSEEDKAELQSRIQQLEVDMMALDEPENLILTPIQENNVVDTDTTSNDVGKGDTNDKGLFVPSNTAGNEEECAMFTPDDLLGGLNKGARGKDKCDEKPIGWVRSRSGLYMVYELGPPSLGNFLIRETDKATIATNKGNLKNLRALRAEEEQDEDGNRIFKAGCLEGILGVVWHYSDEENKFDLLDPEKWPQGSKQKVSPTTYIHAKLKFEKDGVTKYVKRWVPRSAMRKFSVKSSTLQEDIKAGDKVIVSKGQTMKNADIMILNAAIGFDEMYQEYIEAGRTGGHERSPSLYPATNTGKKSAK
ncbi:hypothetical protein F4821DRAFT_274607 [Hypoxylon rubiginosum]|uniref:Uncharacterized protein n=1 Tax=Hypoxylon rubiginosum TaxID=110542 RepID=A0ACC0CN38_9PEZI|nr:hypothetical protein F4821DRAFT_274607 [Hypoxylon rubiginosum]